jgi:outer membrane biosynthesis protein TonB
MVKKRNNSAGMSWLTWAIAGGVACGFMGLVLVAAMNQDFLKSKDLEPILIQAPKTPVKTRPEEPTGMQIPNRDKKVFDLLADSQAAPAAEAQPLAAQPAPKPAPVEEIEEEKAAPEPVKPVEAPAAKVEPKKAAPAPVKVEPKPEPAPQQQAASAAGPYGVQLASFRDQNTAASAALKFQEKFPAELGSLTTYIERADLGAKGVYYRVKFRGIATSAAAQKVCATLKAKGQGCLHGRY